MLNKELIAPSEFNDLNDFETTQFTNNKNCYDDYLEFGNVKNIFQNNSKYDSIFSEEEEKTKVLIVDNNVNIEEAIQTDSIKEINHNFLNKIKIKKISKTFINKKRGREKDENGNKDKDKEELLSKDNKEKSKKINRKKLLNKKEQTNFISKDFKRIKKNILPNLSLNPQKQDIITIFPSLFESGNILTKRKDDYNKFPPNNFDPTLEFPLGQFHSNTNINKVNNKTKNLNLTQKEIKTSFQDKRKILKKKHTSKSSKKKYVK